MSSSHLERVVAAARSSTSTEGLHPAADPFPVTELQVAVASAVSSGEPLAVVAAMADLPSLAVLDAVDALQPGFT
ncbi:hypothetical protein D6T63_02455 [Arthrobacter cheniae]|uniref:Uncharacterized protein n=1 Tax=Arthrobacter cheniae TaxID=1258888 RepID=A0A3A5MJC5_9MICC|nr:hypothetical protein [Arthrobacter cheniae]RJT83324.1 hypothetical protein D6T63_02455 [Arthrobacter cheniae]